jgi:hypothetical protein
VKKYLQQGEGFWRRCCWILWLCSNVALSDQWMFEGPCAYTDLSWHELHRRRPENVKEKHCQLQQIKLLQGRMEYQYLHRILRRIRNGSFVIGKGCGLDVPGSIPRSARLFSITSTPAKGSTQVSIWWVTGILSAGVKWQGREADHLPPSSAKVKNYGDLPPSSSMSSWHSALLIKHR